MFRSLKEDITESQTDIRIQKSDLFEIPLSLNTLQIDNKLIIYNKMEKETDFFLLKDCKKGAFMTKASDHSSKTPLYKLSDHVYKVFFRDLALQDTLPSMSFASEYDLVVFRTSRAFTHVFQI